MIRFHLDEHIPTAIAVGLRQRGIDVTTAMDANLLGAADTDHLHFAAAHGRVLVTHDDDFLRIYALEPNHAGIAYCHQDKYEIGPLLKMLVLLQQVIEADQMKGRVEFL